MKALLTGLGLILLIYGVSFSNNSAPDPNDIIAKTREVYRSIQDFSASVQIEINVDFINIPDKSAKIIYKYPDKIKFKSKSFIMLPKKGIGFMIFKLLEGKNTVLYTGIHSINSRELYIVKIIPQEEDSDVVLATLYIDKEDHRIYRLEATSRDAGFFRTDFEYGGYGPLPTSNRIQFEVDKVRIPLRFLGKVDIDRSKMKSGTKGEVILRFEEYQINEGIQDELFDEEIEIQSE